MARHGDILRRAQSAHERLAFVALSYVFGSDGFGLTQSVRVLSVLALAAAAAFGWWRLRGADRHLWLAGVLLAAVNPMEVAPAEALGAEHPAHLRGADSLAMDRPEGPLSARRRPRGRCGRRAQIHPSGMFVVAALFAGALWDRHRRDLRRGAAALGFRRAGVAAVFLGSDMSSTWRPARRPVGLCRCRSTRGC